MPIYTHEEQNDLFFLTAKNKFVDIKRPLSTSCKHCRHYCREQEGSRCSLLELHPHSLSETGPVLFWREETEVGKGEKLAESVTSTAVLDVTCKGSQQSVAVL